MSQLESMCQVIGKKTVFKAQLCPQEFYAIFDHFSHDKMISKSQKLFHIILFDYKLPCVHIINHGVKNLNIHTGDSQLFSQDFMLFQNRVKIRRGAGQYIAMCLNNLIIYVKGYITKSTGFLLLVQPLQQRGRNVLAYKCHGVATIHGHLAKREENIKTDTWLTCYARFLRLQNPAYPLASIEKYVRKYYTFNNLEID